MNDGILSQIMPRRINLLIGPIFLFAEIAFLSEIRVCFAPECESMATSQNPSSKLLKLAFSKGAFIRGCR